MNTLLIFFAFPIAIIIFSIVLQKLLHSPIAVAAIIFAIFIVITFAVFDQNFLIATLAYTILAFLTALLVYKLHNSNHVCNFCNSNTDSTTCLCNALTNTLENNTNSTNNVIDGLLDLLHNNSDNDSENDDTSPCNTKAASATAVPNDDNAISNNCGYMYNRRCRRF